MSVSLYVFINMFMNESACECVHVICVCVCYMCECVQTFQRSPSSVSPLSPLVSVALLFRESLVGLELFQQGRFAREHMNLCLSFYLPALSYQHGHTLVILVFVSVFVHLIGLFVLF